MSMAANTHALIRGTRPLFGLCLFALAPAACAGDFGGLGLDGLLGSIWAIFGILGSLAALGASYVFYRMAHHRALFTLIAILLISGILSRTLVFLLQHGGGGLAGMPMTALNVLSGIMTFVQWGALVVAGVMAFRPGQQTPPRQ
ncbi:hypothetical protein C7S18_21595 [Ahniella affigens]|uniref:Uncharacterized protein n=1 Tax=Ahniella affigens TaxID=2021234 RepID=A0A2P1PXP1_9GAMM|nr:hypothetical protein [Ahniella affigens]AVP99609.1 hypothetical protein C7S18_21595 [Ahniella affigens]